jgi:hypothetical protein
MMLGPAERLVKHSSLQAWGEGRMVPVFPSSKFEAPEDGAWLREPEAV